MQLLHAMNQLSQGPATDDPVTDDPATDGRANHGHAMHGRANHGHATYGHENPKQRVDRELHELLEEIRVALPGVELLFGFLLILPFSERFEVLGEAQRTIYLVCLLATAAATALFIAPSAQHRAGFRSMNKERLLIRMNRRVIAGLLLVAVAMSLATALIVWIVFDPAWAVVIAIGTVAWCIAWWFLVPPFWRRERTLQEELSSPHHTGAARAAAPSTDAARASHPGAIESTSRVRRTE